MSTSYIGFTSCPVKWHLPRVLHQIRSNTPSSPPPSPYFTMSTSIPTTKADLLQHGQVPDPSTTDAFILEVQRGLDGSRLKFDLEDLMGC